MYFCAGFVIVDHAEEVAENTLGILKLCEHIKVDYPGFDYQFLHHNQLQQISFLAYLAQNNGFEASMLNVFYAAEHYNAAANGLVHCKDDEISDDLLYVWTLINRRLVKHGDVFLSPLSERLGLAATRSLPFLKHFQPVNTGE